MTLARRSLASPVEAESTGARVLPLTLARLADQFLQVADVLSDTDPSDTARIAELEALLDHSGTAVEDKVAALACIIREFEARADIARLEAERISTHARSARCRAEWLRDYLQKNLEILGVERIQTPTCVVALRNSPPSVVIVDEAQIPGEYKQILTTVDKALIRRALVDHRQVAGVSLVYGRHLVIR